MRDKADLLRIRPEIGLSAIFPIRRPEIGLRIVKMTYKGKKAL